MAYEFDGKKYQQASSHQKEWGLRLIQELNLSGAEEILDLGCGDGGLTAQLAELVPRGRVMGIDASLGMIAAARKREGSNLVFLLRDIDDLEFDSEFDVVFSNAALHWVKDHDAMLRNVHRSLKPGGVMRLNFAADGNCSHFFSVIRQAMEQPSFARHFSGFDWPWFMPAVDEYSALMRRLPFAEVRVWGENADRYFPDQDAMIRWIDQPSLVPFAQHMSDADKAQFRSWVIGRMIAETRQPDGSCFETFRRVNVFAKKQS
jgi:trans-aconitate methyltransferase